MKVQMNKNQSPKTTPVTPGDIVEYDFAGKLPERIREEIEVSLAIENEDARSAGKLGFMARALVQATMPYKDPKANLFERRNGDLTLRIVSAERSGVPFGIYPRLLMSWLTTEAVRTQSPEIVLGESLGIFLREMKLTRGYANQNFSNQMQRLFSSVVSVKREGASGFSVKNITLIDEVEVTDADATSFWQPQAIDVAGQWKSRLQISKRFFDEITSNPVPIDLRAYLGLKASPLAMDIYAWLTYRLSYLRAPSAPLAWELLQAQFGSGFAFDGQGQRDFKKSFLKALKSVLLMYKEAKVTATPKGLVLQPSKPHIPFKTQDKLF